MVMLYHKVPEGGWAIPGQFPEPLRRERGRGLRGLIRPHCQTRAGL